jgi:rhamnosyltransferase
MKKIAGAVVLYNPDNNLGDNINSYLKNIDKLYVIDNSNESKKEYIPNSKKIKYIFNGENLGIATALNIAAKNAINDGYEWLLTMDQDSQFPAKELKKLIDFLGNCNKKVGIVCPYHIIKTTEPKPDIDVEERLEVMTSGSLMNLKIYQKIGGFKDWLFIDNVDIDYCLNLNKHGYKVLRLNYVYLQHHLGDATYHRFLWKKIVCSNHNYIRRYYITRNILYTIDMYKKDFPEYCKFLHDCLGYNFKTVVLFEKDKYRKLRNMLRAYRDFKRGIKGKYNYEN